MAVLAVVLAVVYFNLHGWFQAAAHHKVCITKECTLRSAFIISNLNESVNPCDDFWQYSCGGWLEHQPESSGSQWALQDDVVINKLLRLLSHDVSSDDSPAVQVAKKFYKSCTNKKLMQTLGDKPLIHFVNSVFQDLPDDLTARLLQIEKVPSSPLFGLGMDRDYHNSSQYVLSIYQPSLNMLRYRYLENKPPGVLKRYLWYYVRVMSVLTSGLNFQTIRQGQKVIEFETQLANITLSPAQQQDGSASPHTFNISSLQQRYPDLQWRAYIQGVFDEYHVPVEIKDSERVVTRAVHFLDKLFPLLRHTPSDVIKDYLKWSTVQSLISYTDGKLIRLHGAWRKNITGSRGHFTYRRTAEHCVRKTRKQLPDVLGELYTAVYTDSVTRAKVAKMTRRIMTSFGQMIQRVTWLSPQSKRRAAEKLAAMRLEVGAMEMYKANGSLLNEEWGGVGVDVDTYLLNHLALTLRQARLTLRRYRHRPGRHVHWSLTSATANAFYMSLYNAIAIPSGLLQDHMFRHELPPYLNYGSLGFVLGHEVTHGFDADGRKYDAHGNLGSWWSEEDVRHYEGKAACIVEQYEHFKSHRANSSVDGSLTLNENIADNGGITAAFNALDLLLQNSTDADVRMPGLIKLTPKQLFFVAFAQTWCGHASDRTLFCQMKTDEHSPSKYRVLGTIQNSHQFGQTFNCPVGSHMNPPKKCVVW
ncbi:membrane metallo-endopeptidase-like 1 [Littorina saxatilis]|uniref:Uncharacterized protein n=1 Tax=Littorina saxatilis TaxID=31220 RepID=A0AAN9GLF6_9CAEN